MKSIITFILTLLVFLNGASQNFTVTSVKKAKLGGEILKKGMQVSVHDTIEIGRNGLLKLSDESGLIFGLIEGRNTISDQYKKALVAQNIVDSLTSLYVELDLVHCDSVERPLMYNWEYKGAAHVSTYKWELDLKLTNRSALSFNLSWAGPSEHSYFVVGRNFFDEIVYFKETSLTNHYVDLSHLDDQAILVNVLTKTCESSRQILLEKE